MKPLRLLALLILIIGSACTRPSGGGQTGQSIYVFAASSLTDAFNDVGQAFQMEHPGTNVRLNFGGSQALRTQIEQGAPADVFVSASSKDMDTLVQEGFIEPSEPQTLLTNRLVVILPTNNPAQINGLPDLARTNVKVVLAAADVPAGAYARQSLNEMNAAFGNRFSADVLANVVSDEDNVKQVVAKVQLNEADAGIVYVSDAVAAPSLKRIEIPDALNVVATYPIAALKDSKNAALAAEFVAFAVSPTGQSILQKWGFGPAR